MKRKRVATFRIWMLVLPLFLLGAVLSHVLGDEIAPDPDRVPAPSIQAGFEAGTLPIAPSTHKVVRTGIEAQLHQARLAGDAAAVRKLEALLPRQLPVGDAAADMVIRTNVAVTGPGDGRMTTGGAASKGQTMSGSKLLTLFGSDRHVRYQNFTNAETYQTAATDSEGNVYVAFLIDAGTGTKGVQVYKSNSDGVFWDAFAYVAYTGAECSEPCIAVGEGNEDKLLIAYIVDDGVSIPYPEVSTTDLASYSGWTTTSVPTWSWEGYAKPVIWTDAWDFNGWYAYLTCEGIVDSATKNINICSWKSTNFGATWGNQFVVAGNTDPYEWIDPDGSYGTTDNLPCLAFYNATDESLYFTASADFGSTYGTPASIYTLTAVPTHAVDPEIAAALYHDNIMVCCTRMNGGTEVIGQMYSIDSGASWSTMWPLNGASVVGDFAASLHAGEGGGNWHLAFTSDHHVMYSSRPQDLSDYWQGTTDFVDDAGIVSHVHTKKGITANWDLDAPGIAWSDYRDGSPDYDTYFDFEMNPYIYYVPKEYNSIQAAMDASMEGNIVLVSEGTYFENIDYKGKMLFVYAEGEAMDTVIDGSQAGSVVTFANGEGVKSVLVGFTLTNGNAAAGGAVYCDGSTPQLVNCVMYENSAVYGGAVFCYDADPILTHVTISENAASIAGGGIYLKNFSNPEVRNSILWDDTAPSGAEIFVEAGTPDVTYCDVEGGWPGVGNINVLPVFMWPPEGDFHIVSASACKDAGSGALGGLPSTDWEGDPRGAAPDMGADEHYRHSYVYGNLVAGGNITLNIMGPPSVSGCAYFFSSNQLTTPYPGTWWDWMLGNPLYGPYILGPMTALGAKSLSGNIPASPLYPYTIYLQSIVGPPYEFTNCAEIHIN